MDFFVFLKQRIQCFQGFSPYCMIHGVRRFLFMPCIHIILWSASETPLNARFILIKLNSTEQNDAYSALGFIHKIGLMFDKRTEKQAF